MKLHDVINCKEQKNSVRINKDVFQGENMQTQYSVLGYKIDLYFHEYKLAIEIEELGHILTTKYKHKKQQKKNLVAYLLELILTKKNFVFLKP